MSCCCLGADLEKEVLSDEAALTYGRASHPCSHGLKSGHKKREQKICFHYKWKYFWSLSGILYVIKERVSLTCATSTQLEITCKLMAFPDISSMLPSWHLQHFVALCDLGPLFFCKAREKTKPNFFSKILILLMYTTKHSLINVILDCS